MHQPRFNVLGSGHPVTVNCMHACNKAYQISAYDSSAAENGAVLRTHATTALVLQ